MKPVTIGFTGGPRGEVQVTLPMAEILRHSLVLGKSGSGKTMWAIGVVCQLLANRAACATIIDMKGETCDVLRSLLPLLDRTPALVPSDVLSFSLSRGALLPLDPLVAVPGMEPAVQAGTVVDLLAGLSDGGFGPRMVMIARSLVAAVMGVGGSLLDVRALLVDERFAPWLAQQCPDPELRQYLAFIFPAEPAASKDSLRARFDNLLALPAVRSMLTCGRCTPGPAFLGSPLALIDLGGAGMGSKGITTFVGGWIFTLIATAIYARDPQKHPKHAYVLLDEWQRLAARAADDLEDILATARSNGVSLTLCNQYAAQISQASPALWEGVKTNVALEVLFRPDSTDLTHLGHVLPVTGRVVDPERPDRLLTVADERRRLVQHLSTLPPRHALVVRHLTNEPASVVRTASLPLAEADRAWRTLSQSERDRWLFGRSAVPASQLNPQRLAIPSAMPAVTRSSDRASDEEPDEAPTRARSGGRPKLRVLP